MKRLVTFLREDRKERPTQTLPPHILSPTR
jgi:hypothetical protein